VPNGVVPRPSKKQTLNEMRAILAGLGMDTNGNKENVYK
jgi:hypothetical protein